jgi:diguanylate cyclase (GGDEF)-like protein
MSDNENPQPGGGASEAPAAPAESPPNAALASAATAAAVGAGGSLSAGPPSSAGRVWRAAALVCLTAGVLASAFGARALARHDAANARNDFGQTSTSIASTLNVAIKHEEQLTVSASTFFAERPHASAAEFARWKVWARTRDRYPELAALGFVPLADASTALLASRDAAAGIYSAVPSARGPALAIETPVYRGAVTPHSVFGRRAAGVGWLRVVLVPGVVLGEALAGQEGYAARLRYSGGSSALEYAHGAPESKAQSRSIVLRGGWSMTSFGPPADAGVPADAGALALLICGILASALLAVLLFLRGRPVAPASAMPVTPAPGQARTRGAENAHEDLYDSLTGLANRALMLDRAERLIARTGRQSEAIAGALFVEVDWVEDVNDRLGREAGDELLRVIARRLEQVVRAGDSVSRPGGAAFMVLVESAARGVRLDSLARRAIEALREPVELAGFGPSFVLGTKVGIAFGRYETPAALLRDAETAAGAAGKDRYKLFNANTRATTDGHELLESELNAAMDDRQLFLLYEPIRDLRERRVSGLQALIRWRHPERGVLESTDFMALARETGLIVPLGRWQLERACTDAAAWNIAGEGVEGRDGHVGVSVRVSSEQLNREGFLTDVRRALQLSGLDPSLLTIDVSEATVMGELAPGAERLHELDRLGVRVALDGFGSRYASHADLARMPLRCLKVDRGSIAASDTDDYRRWLLETILVTGRDLDLPVIVRGVQTPEQLSALQAIGATIVQGAILGKPAPADFVERLLGVPPAPAESPTATVPVPPAVATAPDATTPAAVTAPTRSTPAPATPKISPAEGLKRLDAKSGTVGQGDQAVSDG